MTKIGSSLKSTISKLSVPKLVKHTLLFFYFCDLVVLVVQTVLSGHDVVLQCRDEGDERAEVFWSRDDGVPIPARAIQIRGRLDISGIRFDISLAKIMLRMSTINSYHGIV